MNKIAIITGATSGIGEATARILSKNNFDIIITGRRCNRLDKLKSELTTQYKNKILTLNFDIRIFSEVENAIKTLPKEWQNIDILINNAGLAAGLHPINEGLIEDWEQMIDTNIKGLLYISKLISQIMIKRKKGHIINITSIAGKDIYENGNVYCGTKSAVEQITKGMRIDLLKHNIKVTSIAPGMVETEFSLVRFKGDNEKAKTPYIGLIPLSAFDVAEAILFAVTRPQHVNINDMLIMPTSQATATYTHRN
jgi:3-hydroxy acid dehydrogenase / malonic semialdehyde reductase